MSLKFFCLLTPLQKHRGNIFCLRPDLNRHAVKHWFLRPGCLPIPSRRLFILLHSNSSTIFFLLEKILRFKFKLSIFFFTRPLILKLLPPPVSFIFFYKSPSPFLWKDVALGEFCEMLFSFSKIFGLDCNFPLREDKEYPSFF